MVRNRRFSENIGSKVCTDLSHSYPETIEKFIHVGKDIMKIVRKIVNESQNELGGLETD